MLAEAGKIDVLVNNAGIASAGVTEAFTTEQAKAIFDTNVIGLLRVTRAVLPSMRQQHDGLIINIGSILGRVTFPFLGIYGASKFAVEALTDSLRYEVSPARRRGRGGAAERIPDQLLHQHSDARRHRSHRVLRRGRPHPRRHGHVLDSRRSRARTPQIRTTSRRPSLKLVGQAKGSRAVRTVVGAPFGSDKANEDVAPVQAKVVEALGLSHLEKVA